MFFNHVPTVTKHTPIHFEIIIASAFIYAQLPGLLLLELTSLFAMHVIPVNNSTTPNKR
jgi:hypothetical protein